MVYWCDMFVVLGLYADCISGHIMILELNVKGVGLIYDDGV